MRGRGHSEKVVLSDSREDMMDALHKNEREEGKERRNETSDRRLQCPMYHVEGTRNKIGGKILCKRGPSYSMKREEPMTEKEGGFYDFTSESVLAVKQTSIQKLTRKQGKRLKMCGKGRRISQSLREWLDIQRWGQKWERGQDSVEISPPPLHCLSSTTK